MEKRVLAILVVAILIVVVAIGYLNNGTEEMDMMPADNIEEHSDEMTEAGYYSCPMHSDVEAHEAGNCPVCGMDLVFVANESDHEHDGDVYTCPMHPEVAESDPGSCPVCGMDMVAKES